MVTTVKRPGFVSSTDLTIYESGVNIAMGSVSGSAVVQKFGHNPSVGTSFVPVTAGGIYLTPQAASATALRVKAGNTNDTAAGSGAREITLEGLDETGAYVTEAVATAGTSASSSTSATFMRLYRAYVSASGTYATSAAGSHTAAIVIENGAGGTDWATLPLTGFPSSQTEIGVYSVPLAKTAYLTRVSIETQSTKKSDVILFQRANILESAAPYTAMREFQRFIGIDGVFDIAFKYPFKFNALTDFGAMGEVTSGTGAISINMEILVVDD